jgi:demethoxyubiquinone hydroxylase (CLK1/Coq7/Cat5 family)
MAKAKAKAKRVEVDEVEEELDPEVRRLISRRARELARAFGEAGPNVLDEAALAIARLEYTVGEVAALLGALGGILAEEGVVAMHYSDQVEEIGSDAELIAMELGVLAEEDDDEEDDDDDAEDEGDDDEEDEA